jgi:hypothetical protein
VLDTSQAKPGKLVQAPAHSCSAPLVAPSGGLSCAQVLLYLVGDGRAIDN